MPPVLAASLRSIVALTPVIKFPVGIEKPKFVASRLVEDPLAAIVEVAYALLDETMFDEFVQPEPVPAAFALDVAAEPSIVTSPPTSTDELAPVMLPPFFRIRHLAAATEPGIATVSIVRQVLGLSW